ncbi:MAG TPA: ABC transporter permease [Vicinamibacterales bacterium]|nr:ABC transporter permease [Vicinamibacterales bacterium]
MGTLLRLLSLLVPREYRPRWREEWLAEKQHGGRRMITGALPDAWTLRRLLKGSGRASRRRAPIFHALDQDVRYALRGFGSGTGFTVAVVGSLALGIAATTTAFALVNATLLRPFPGVHNQEELVRIRVGMGRAYVATSWDEYQLLRNSLTSLHDLSAAHQTRFAIAAGGDTEPRTHDGLVVTGNYFGLLGVKPAHGRFFAADEDAQPPAAAAGAQLFECRAQRTATCCRHQSAFRREAFRRRRARTHDPRGSGRWHGGNGGRRHDRGDRRVADSDANRFAPDGVLSRADPAAADVEPARPLRWFGRRGGSRDPRRGGVARQPRPDRADLYR